MVMALHSGCQLLYRPAALSRAMRLTAAIVVADSGICPANDAQLELFDLTLWELRQ